MTLLIKLYINFKVYSTHITICDIIGVRLNDKSQGQADWGLGARIKMACLAI